MVERYHQTVTEARKELADYLRGKLRELIGEKYEGQFFLGTGPKEGKYWYMGGEGRSGVYLIPGFGDPEKPEDWHARRIAQIKFLLINFLQTKTNMGKMVLLELFILLKLHLEKRKIANCSTIIRGLIPLSAPKLPPLRYT